MSLHLSLAHHVRCISPIVFEVEIPNLVCMYLGMVECCVPFLGHSDLVDIDL